MSLVTYCIINEVELSYAMAAGAGRKSMILSQHTLRTSVCYCALRKCQKSKTQKSLHTFVSKYTWIVFSKQTWCFEQNACCYFCWASLIADKLKLFAWTNIINGWLFMFTKQMWWSLMHNMHNIYLIHLINNVLAKVWKLRIYEWKPIVWDSSSQWWRKLLLKSNALKIYNKRYC